MTHRMMLMPTEPVAAKILDGVEKTWLDVSQALVADGFNLLPVPIILLRIKNTEPVIPIFRSSE